jgi:prepilin-type N-terminal cleavage/methylation domain-containing protein
LGLFFPSPSRHEKRFHHFLIEVYTMTKLLRRKRQAFTLVELLVVIAIIGVLVALLLPAVQAAREAARRSSCQNKIRQLAIGLHNHHDTMNKLPPGAENQVYIRPDPTNARTLINGTSWIVYILPFIEQQNLYERYYFDKAYNDPLNALVGEQIVPTLYCPSGPDAKKHLDPNTNLTKCVTTHYYGVMGPAGLTNPTTITINGQDHPYTVGDPTANGAWSAHGMLSHYRETTGSVSSFRVVRLSDVIDGTSQTLMLAERSMHLPPGQSNDYRTWIRGNAGGSGACKNVMNPINAVFYNGSNNFNHISFGSSHPAGCSFAMGDASVKFLPVNVDLTVYMASASMNGRENVTLP